MLKDIVVYFFLISFIINFEAESISLGRRKKPIKEAESESESVKCNNTYDCYDFRMICSEKKCKCAKFHDLDPNSKRCLVNISEIAHWLQATASTDPGYVSQQEDFDKVQVGGSTLLNPKWAEYEAVEETGISHITRVLWPIMLGSLFIFVVYGAILLEFL